MIDPQPHHRPQCPGESEAAETPEFEQASAGETTQVGRIGRFEIKGMLGQGGFGTVFRAYDPTLDREVALKVPACGPGESDKIKRFLTEAKAAARLRHPNIVAVFESGQADGRYLIASEFVEGVTLAEWLAENRCGAVQAATWVRTLAEALAYAHQEGIIHRDIKPGNVMIDRHGRPQLMDFGLAKRLDDEASLTAEGLLLGTPAYMSPEQASGRTGEVGPLSDQYSLGVVLYELLSGQKPFEGPPHTVILKIVTEEPVPLGRLSAGIPRDLDAICQKAMQKEPGRRYASLADMAADLDNWLSGKETSARPVGPGERAARWCRRNRAVTTFIGTTVALLVLVATVTTMAYLREADLRKKADAAVSEANRLREVAVLDRDAARQAEQSEAAARRAAEDSLRTARIATAARKQAESAAQTAQQREAAATQRVLSREEADRRLALSYRERAQEFVQNGQIREGVLWLAKCLQTLPEGADDVEYSVRTELAQRQAEFSPLVRVIPHGSPATRTVFTRPGEVVTAGRDSVRVWRARKEATRPWSFGPADVWIAKRNSDGRFLVTAGGRYAPSHHQLWNPRTGQRIGPAMAEGQGDVTSVVFGPRDKLFLVTYRKRGALRTTSGAVQVFSTATGKAVGPVLATSGQVRLAEFNEDGSIVVTVSERRSGRAYEAGLALWDASQGTLLTVRRTMDPLQDAFVSPDRRRLLTLHPAASPGRTDVELRNWDITDELQSPRNRVELPGRVPFVRFSPNSHYALLGVRGPTSGPDHARLYGIHSHRLLRKPILHDGIQDGAFDPGNRIVLTGGADRFARLWDTSTGNPVGSPLPHENTVTDVAFSPDGKTLFTKTWSPAGSLSGANEPAAAKRLDAPPDAPASTVRLWQAATRAPIGPPRRYAGDVRCSFSRDGKRIVLVGPQTLDCLHAATMQPIGNPIDLAADAEKNRSARFLTLRLRTSSSAAAESTRTVAVGPDGESVLLRDDDHVRLWDLDAQEPRGREPVPRGLLATVAARGGIVVDSCGNQILVAEHSGWQFRDPATAQPIGEPVEAVGAFAERGAWRRIHLRNVAFSRNRPLAVVHDEGTLQIVNTNWNAPETPLIDVDAQSVALSHDGRKLLVTTLEMPQTSPPAGSHAERATTGRVFLYDSLTRQPVGVPRKETRLVRAAAFLPDNQRLIVALDEGTELWNLETGASLRSWPLKILGPGRLEVTGPDRVIALTQGRQGYQAIQIWDIRRGEEVFRIRSSGDEFVTFSLPSDGRSLKVATTKMVQVWDIAPQRLVGEHRWDFAEPVVAVALCRRSTTVVTRSDQFVGDYHFWKVPAPMAGSREQIQLWAQLNTGMELDGNGHAVPLDAPSWRTRSGRLAELGGPPTDEGF